MAFSNAAQKASAVLIQKGATTIGGIKTKSITIDSEIVDVTTADDVNRWRQLLGATGVKKMAISGSGVVKDTAAQQAMTTDVIAQTLDTYTFTVPGIGTFSGLFQLNQFQVSGPFNAEADFTASWESAGDITFTAEA